MDRVYYFSWLDDYRDALGMKVIEDFRLKIEYLRHASGGLSIKQFYSVFYEQFTTLNVILYRAD